MKLTNVSSTTSEYILKALMAAQEQDRKDAHKETMYEMNPADVINEEDVEESVGDMTAR